MDDRLQENARGHPPSPCLWGRELAQRKRKDIFSVVLFTAVWIVTPGLVCAQEQRSVVDLTQMDLEDLMQLEVTSVSKKEERLFEAAAAIYVVTQEDIRRSGATSIPEALRMVPSLHVARINANEWAISSRGFNGELANKLLVLLDGRSVFSPHFSGVYWDVQDLMLEDIERIEVIRGPGATLWGANAVNGVINIISKSAKETQGLLVTGGGGTEERGFGGVRYGGKLGEQLSYRVYLKYFDRDGFVDDLGGDTPDGWDMLRGGFWLDWKAASRDTFTFHGDLYGGTVGERLSLSSFEPPFQQLVDHDMDVSGGNVVARWDRVLSQRSNLSLQLYYDRTERQDARFRSKYQTFDLEWQHDFAFGRRQHLTWGLGYRLIVDDIGSTSFVSYTPHSRNVQLFSGFVQDEISLFPDRLLLTVGAKFEHNDYSGFEVQPSTRLLWTPHKRHTLWAAISRAVRTPSRSDIDVRSQVFVFPLPGGLLGETIVLGNRQFKAEELRAYELGYRLEPFDSAFLDLAVFYNTYDNLTTTEPGAPSFEFSPPPPHLVIPVRFDNKGHGETYGVEIAANWTPTPWWKLASGYTWFDVRLRHDPSSRAPGFYPPEEDSPRHQFNFRSYLNLPWGLEFDILGYYVHSLPGTKAPGLGPPIPRIPSYLRLDLRLGWRATDNLEFSLVGQNLVERRHPEFRTSGSAIATEIERGMYGKVTWKF